MKALHDIRPGQLSPTCVAVGVFDGVHVGHRAVLREAVAQAARVGVTAAALTFDPHPERLLRPKHAPGLLTTIVERAALIAETGIEVLLVACFDRALASQTPEEFVRCVLLKQLGARCVVAGEGFVFGRGGRGDIHTLLELGQRLGFRAVAVKRVAVEGVTVSSTQVRQLIAAGEVERAARFLGHHYIISGRVVRGARRGRSLGAPTANVCVEECKLLPPNGVYAVKVRIEQEPALLPAVANIGVRPTFGGDASPCVEAHLLDVAASVGARHAGARHALPLLYDRAVTLEVVARLREERAFPDAQALSQQIQRDITAAREILADRRPPHDR